jgi:hypothetical protein
MTHARQNKTFTIKMLNNQAQLPRDGGLIVDPQTPPNAADNQGDGLLMLDSDSSRDGAFLIVD